MNLEGLQELLKEIEKVGMDHIDEEKVPLIVKLMP